MNPGHLRVIQLWYILIFLFFLVSSFPRNIQYIWVKHLSKGKYSEETIIQRSRYQKVIMRSVLSPTVTSPIQTFQRSISENAFSPGAI